MKRGTIEHPKMIMLASQLSCPKYAAVGLLECLWHFTSRYAPQGNVGKFSDQVIADSLGWKDDPKKLISALIACNFLEIEKTHRLIVHDWSHHADDAVNKFLKRRKLRFVDGLKPFAKVTTKARPRHDKGTPEECPIYDQPVPLPLPTPEPTPTPKKQKNKTIVEQARPDEPDHTQDIFAYWQSELNHPQSRLDKKRRAAIKARLDEGYTSERIKQAIRGIKNCPHNMGQNDRATIYDDIELICRSGKNVDRFADAETAKPRFTGQERYENALLTGGAG